jgi:hypothetical protein
MDCLACGNTPSSPSLEHVFARWLLEEFGPDARIDLFRLHHDGASEQVRDTIKLDSFKLKKVCAACNNGWMSELENAAKPLILEVIRDNRALDSFSEEERRILARWAGKTAIIESHSIGAECPVNGEYLKRIRTNPDGVPGRFAVVACRTELIGFGHFQAGIIRDLIGGGTASGNIIVIALPKLAFACAFPMLETPYICKCVRSLFTPLWPHPNHWRAMNHTPMPTGLVGGEMLPELAERVELLHSVK